MSDEQTLAGVPPPLAPSEETPRQIGDYAVESLLGEGGGGSVYKARHRKDGRVVAMKILRSDHARSKDMVSRFLQEAHVVNRIHHPNLVEVFEVGTTPDGRPFMCMEYLEGETLRQLMTTQGRLSPLEVLGHLKPICLALHAAHAAGFVHRDIKASNVMVVNQGGRPITKLLDFGIAKNIHADPAMPALTKVGTRVGTPSAMAPEQIRGENVDARTDVYGLGILLFDLLTGERPFAGITATLAEAEAAHLHTPPPVPSAKVPMSPAIDAVVLRCLEKEPEKRFASVLDVMDAFVAAALPSDSDGNEQSRLALGVQVEVRIPPEVVLTEEAQDEMEMALVDAAGDLQNAGFRLPIESATAFLAVWMPAQAHERGSVPKILPELQRVMQRLRSQVSDTQPGLQVMAFAHMGQVALRNGTRGSPEITGGPLLNARMWLPPDFRQGLWATAAAADALGCPRAPEQASVLLG